MIHHEPAMPHLNYRQLEKLLLCAFMADRSPAEKVKLRSEFWKLRNRLIGPPPKRPLKKVNKHE